VPVAALLDGGTVSAVLGGRWEESTTRPLGCDVSTSGVAERSVAYRTTDGEVLQTVATYGSPAQADRAVKDAGRNLEACGWKATPDPRLGSASTAATSANGSEKAVIVATEGVTVALVGSDMATSNALRWTSLVDVALGNVCAAAADGCH
jgi:hypothetical protein